VLVRREDAECFIEEVCGDDPEHRSPTSVRPARFKLALLDPQGAREPPQRHGDYLIPAIVRSGEFQWCCGMAVCWTLRSASEREGGERMDKKRLFAIAFCAAALMGVSATGALAGEVKGPPTGGTPNTNETAGPDHANSACVFSGLNDNINGPIGEITQTPGNQGDPGAPGHGAPGFPNGCRGGSNPDNPPSS
jgi:hypothetical protein